MIINKIYTKLSNKWSYRTIKTLKYSEQLQCAYASGSVAEGSLKGKRVMITGATGGIGFALVNRFIKEGCRLLLVGRNEEKLKKLTKLFSEKTEHIEYLTINLSDANDIKKQLDKIKEVDILINNAGMFTDYDKKRKFREVKEDVYDEVVNTNIKSVMLLTQYVVDGMTDRKDGGYIINISSICGIYKEFQYTPYGISKASIIGYTEKMAEKYKDKNIVFVTIAPGSVATIMGDYTVGDNITKKTTSLLRVVLPEEVAALSARLSTNVGKYLNGKVIKLCANEKF